MIRRLLAALIARFRAERVECRFVDQVNGREVWLYEWNGRRLARPRSLRSVGGAMMDRRSFLRRLGFGAAAAVVAPEALAKLAAPSAELVELLGVEMFSVDYPGELVSNARITEIWRKCQTQLVEGLRNSAISDEEWLAVLRPEIDDDATYGMVTGIDQATGTITVFFDPIEEA